MVPLRIPKIKNSTDFGHLILVVSYFQFFLYFFIFVNKVTLRPYSDGKDLGFAGFQELYSVCGSRRVLTSGPWGGAGLL